MITINDYLKYVESSDVPLSSNVYIIDGNKNTYVYDVGRNDEAYNVIQSIDKDKIVIISHFHGDHFENIKRISYSELYVGGYTYKHINLGNVVREKIEINDGIKLEIIPISSVHAKGSLVLNINNEYCLISDLVYSDKEFNKSLYCMMIQELEKIDTKYFVTGHTNNCIFEKSEYISSLKQTLIG